MFKSIESSDLSVDKVTLNVIGLRIKGISTDKYEKISEKLVEHFFRVISNGRYAKKYRFRKSTNVDGEGSFYYNRAESNANLKFSFTFNPTKLYRLKLEPKDDKTKYERSYDGGFNYLPDNLTQDNTNSDLRSQIFDRFSYMIEDIIHDLTSVIDECQFEKQLDLNRFQISIEDIELYKDVYQKNSIIFIHENSDIFRSHFQKSNARIYTPPHIDLTTDRNSIGLRCQLQSGTSIHIYSKLENSIRIEFSFKKTRIQDKLGSNVLNETGAEYLSNTCIKLAEEASKWANEFFEKTLVGDLTLGLDKILYQIARRCATFDKFVNIINQLSTKGSIKADSSNRYAVYTLHNEGILKRRTSAVYSLPVNDFSLLKSYQIFRNQLTTKSGTKSE